MGSKSDTWRGHLAGWRDSGLSQAAYCRQQGLALASFGYWRRKLEGPARAVRDASSPALLPVVVGGIDASETMIEVRLGNGLEVRLPVAMETAHWMPLVQALRAC
ncbi:MAG: hypothetical protein L0H83_15600, partial [Salinisphaera sp.]|nr:hypothetical protein [Salinisphaera sp.]